MKFTTHKMVAFFSMWLLLTPLGSGPIRAHTKTHNCVTDTPEKTIAEAVMAVTGLASSGDPRELFAHALQLRGAVVPENEKPKYWREMKAKPELAKTTIYETGSMESQDVLKIIRPALILFQRNWDVAVVKQDAPFVGVFRQCIFIVSTGLLDLITDEQLLGFAAHELAHECFIEELRAADHLGCASAYHLVEFKSDLIAALCCLILKRDPLALVSGVGLVEAYYLRNEPSILQGNTHPNAAWRHRCIDLFLTRINKSDVPRFRNRSCRKSVILGGRKSADKP